MPEPLPVLDGHNDLLLRLWKADPAARDALWLGGAGGPGHLDLARMRQGGFAGGFFAIFVPSPSEAPDRAARMDNPPYDIGLPAPMTAAEAQPAALQQVALLLRMERVSGGAFRVCRTLADLRACLDSGTIAGIMHLEGAEAIGADLDTLHAFHAIGLRSLGPVWSRPTIFAHGVPFRFPSSPDTGPGLTGAGRDLVRACNELRILIDLSHLNEAGFNDVAALSKAPLVATHSNAHAVTPSARNLTDRQLDAIRDSDGMVGLNFATGFLRPDGRRSAEMTLEPVLRHLDHLIGRLGEGRVGFGSDFDGAEVPRDIGDVTGLPRLIDALAAHGYDAALRRRLAHENWLAALGRTWAA